MRGSMRWDLLKNTRQNLPLNFLEPRLRRFNQANTAGSLREDPIVIVPQTRAILLVPESLEIGDPVQFAGIELEPIGQGADGFDGRNIPRRSRCNGLHLLRPGQPMLDRQFVAVFRPDALKAAVVEKKLNHIAMAGTRPAAYGFEISLRQRAKPAPGPAQRPAAAGDQLFYGGFPGEKGPGKYAEKRRVRHAR